MESRRCFKLKNLGETGDPGSGSPGVKDATLASRSNSPLMSTRGIVCGDDSRFDDNIPKTHVRVSSLSEFPVTLPSGLLWALRRRLCLGVANVAATSQKTRTSKGREQGIYASLTVRSNAFAGQR